MMTDFTPDGFRINCNNGFLLCYLSRTGFATRSETFKYASNL